jgi:mono/diheme cytochrome c family protein
VPRDTAPVGRRTRPAAGLAAIALVVVAVAAMVVVGVAGTRHQQDRARTVAGRVTLDAADRQGRALFASSCAGCHTLSASNAVGRTGPNLDMLKPPAAAVVAAIADGKGRMPAGLLTGLQRRQVAEYVAKVTP